MTPLVQTFLTTTGGTLTVTVDDTGTTYALVDDTVAPAFTILVDPTVSKGMAEFTGNAEEVRALEILRTLQGQFEQEMGADLMAFNSQALVKDADYQYKLVTTRLAFDAYQKGLDGPPAP